jgi:hypothetical protein
MMWAAAGSVVCVAIVAGVAYRIVRLVLEHKAATARSLAVDGVDARVTELAERVVECERVADDCAARVRKGGLGEAMARRGVR